MREGIGGVGSYVSDFLSGDSNIDLQTAIQQQQQQQSFLEQHFTVPNILSAISKITISSFLGGFDGLSLTLASLGFDFAADINAETLIPHVTQAYEINLAMSGIHGTIQEIKNTAELSLPTIQGLAMASYVAKSNLRFDVKMAILSGIQQNLKTSLEQTKNKKATQENIKNLNNKIIEFKEMVNSKSLFDENFNGIF